MKRYIYEGTVISFNKIISNKWRGETYAPSCKKASNNLAYQFKKQYGLLCTARIKLGGEPKVV